MSGPHNSDVSLATRFRGAGLMVDIDLSDDDLVSLLEELKWEMREKIALDILDGDLDSARKLADTLDINKRMDLAKELMSDMSPAERDGVLGWFCDHCAERESVRYAVDEVEDTE